MQGGEDVLLLDAFPPPQDIYTLPRLPLSLAAGPGAEAGEPGELRPALQQQQAQIVSCDR